MGPSGRVVGYADKGYFADELIKMSHEHFARQSARMTRVVKVAHVGQSLARQQELEKQAISLGGVKSFLGAVGGAAKKLAPKARSAGQAVSGAAKSVGQRASAAVSKVRTGAPKAVASTTPRSTPNIPKPTTGGVTARPIQQVGGAPTPKPQAAPTPKPQAAPQPSAAAAQGAGPVPPGKPGVAGRVFGGAKQVVEGGLSGKAALGEGATTGQKVLNVAGRLGAGVAGYGPDTASSLGGGALLYGGSKVVGAVRKALGTGKLNRQVGKAIKQTGTKAVRDADVIGGMGLRNLGSEGAQAAANIGMSPRQLHALDDLADQGANLPRSTRRKLERAAGVSQQEIQEMGGVENVLRSRSSRVAPAGRVGGGGGGAAPKSRGLLGGVAGTALTVGVPLAGGLAASAAYQGMQGLADKNRTTQYQHGARGAPINYSPTSFFPAGQIQY